MKNNQKDSGKASARQGAETVIPEPLKIGSGTPYDFSARNLTAYCGLLPVATMLEKLGFQQLVEETLSIGRQTRVMPVYRFVLASCWRCRVFTAIICGFCSASQC